jgi:hypothetical protein
LRARAWCEGSAIGASVASDEEEVGDEEERGRARKKGLHEVKTAMQGELATSYKTEKVYITSLNFCESLIFLSKL